MREKLTENRILSILLVALLGFVCVMSLTDATMVASADRDETGMTDINFAGYSWAVWLIIAGIVVLVLAIPKGLIKKKDTKRLLKIVGVLCLTAGVMFVAVVPILASMVQQDSGYNASWKINISQDTTTGDWIDTIVADVDLWATTEGSCNDVEKSCTVLISATMSTDFNPSNNTIAPDEALVKVSAKRLDDDPDIPNNEDYANLYFQWTSAIPVLVNSSSGDTASMLAKNSFGEYHMWVYDVDNTAHRVHVGDKISLGLFQPGDSDDDLRVGFKFEPEGFGYEPYDVGESWMLGFTIGNTQVIIIVELHAQS